MSETYDAGGVLPTGSIEVYATQGEFVLTPEQAAELSRRLAHGDDTISRDE